MVNHPARKQMKEPTRKTASVEIISFRWRYLALPIVVLLLSLILTAYFYPRLPNEVVYHFTDGAPDRWLSRGAIIAGMLTPQFLFTLLAGAIVWGITKLGRRSQPPASQWVKNIISLMGNMIALPQILLGFAMLDIFSYNAYQIHLMPLWIFALIVMGIGGIILGVFFVLAIRQVRGTSQGITR